MTCLRHALLEFKTQYEECGRKTSNTIVCKEGERAHGAERHVLLPCRPSQWIIWVSVRGVGNKDQRRVSSSSITSHYKIRMCQ